MLEILFVIGFVAVLVKTGISPGKVILALVLAAVLMMLGGFITLVFKLLPWLLLAVVGVWLWRSMNRKQSRYY